VSKITTGRAVGIEILVEVLSMPLCTPRDGQSSKGGYWNQKSGTNTRPHVAKDKKKGGKNDGPKTLWRKITART
jgi:hypothetical protein